MIACPRCIGGQCFPDEYGDQVCFNCGGHANTVAPLPYVRETEVARFLPERRVIDPDEQRRQSHRDSNDLWRIKNPEREADYDTWYREQHREQARAYGKAYRERKKREPEPPPVLSRLDEFRASRPVR